MQQNRTQRPTMGVSMDRWGLSGVERVVWQRVDLVWHHQVPTSNNTLVHTDYRLHTVVYIVTWGYILFVPRKDRSSPNERLQCSVAAGVLYRFLRNAPLLLWNLGSSLSFIALLKINYQDASQTTDTPNPPYHTHHSQGSSYVFGGNSGNTSSSPESFTLV